MTGWLSATAVCKLQHSVNRKLEMTGAVAMGHTAETVRLRIPSHDGHGSKLMVDTVPRWRRKVPLGQQTA